MCGRLNPNHNCLLAPDDLVGRRVAVRWFVEEDEGVAHWYNANVTAYDGHSSKHTLCYDDDGSVTEDALADRFWRFVQNTIEVIE